MKAGKMSAAFHLDIARFACTHHHLLSLSPISLSHSLLLLSVSPPLLCALTHSQRAAHCVSAWHIDCHCVWAPQPDAACHAHTAPAIDARNYLKPRKQCAN